MAIRILVTGAAGRMGGAVIRAVRATPELSLAGAVDRKGVPAIGQDAGLLAGAGEVGVKVQDDAAQAIATCRPEVVIDFTAPEATRAHAAICAGQGVALVAGTTGLGAAERQAISEAATRVPIVLAPNMSVGVNVLLKAVGEVARLLGEGYDIEVLEAHHRMKKDAPSGTALKLAEVLAQSRGGAPLRHGRQGMVGERPRDEIGMAVLRGGDVAGEHTVFFFGEGERIELTHRATSRDQFARGAARAARWVFGRKPGLYDMQDVLGLREAP